MEYKYKEIKNFLPKEQFKSLQDLMFSNTFPWFFQPHQTKNDGYFMSHNFFYDNKPNSVFYEDYIVSIIQRLKLLRQQEATRIKEQKRLKKELEKAKKEEEKKLKQQEAARIKEQKRLKKKKEKPNKEEKKK